MRFTLTVWLLIAQVLTGLAQEPSPRQIDTLSLRAEVARLPLTAQAAALSNWGSYLLDPVYPLEQKIDKAAELSLRLQMILLRPDSYDFAFDTLKFISRIYPEDQSFRVFTWQVTDSLQNHLYFGLIQRKISRLNRADSLAVVVLNDVVDRSELVEQLVLGPETWMGALYYQPRNTPYGVLTYNTTVRMLNPKGKVAKKTSSFYVLLGYNGHQQGSNYKIIEVLSFESGSVGMPVFGAPVLYDGGSPKSRIVFKYSDNATFGLNWDAVRLGKKERFMIVFDRLGRPNDAENTLLAWDVGAEGVQDALDYVDQWVQDRKGLLALRKEVRVIDPSLEALSAASQQRRLRLEQERLRREGIVPATTAAGSR